MSGLIIYLLRHFYFGDTVDTCRLTPFHGIITFFWGLTFIQLSAREESKLAYNWGTSTLESPVDSETSAFTSRHEFKGELRKSLVTGRMEKHYPSNIRRLKYVVSSLITVVLLAVAFVAMLLSLNAQGFIKHQQKVHHGEDCAHPFHYPWFAALAEKGAMFDSKSRFCCYIPVVLHVTLVLFMNPLYRKLADILTKWESKLSANILLMNLTNYCVANTTDRSLLDHESQLNYNNSMIIKRFCFEATDCYLVLLFLAFYEQDVIKVRSELVSVFNVDLFRRILLEGVIPYIMQQSGGRKLESGAFKKNDKKAEIIQSRLLKDVNKEEY